MRGAWGNAPENPQSWGVAPGTQLHHGDTESTEKKTGK
jgi:hypothetical protein